MRIITSLAIALSVLPAAVAAATPAPPLVPEPAGSPTVFVLPHLGEAPLVESVTHLSARVRRHARRLGLTAAPPVRPARSHRTLAVQELRLARIATFLPRLHQAGLTIEERPAVRVRTGESLGSGGLAREHEHVARLALRLGIAPPAAPRAARTPAARAEQLALWRAGSRWLARRSESIPHYDALMCIADHESSRTWGISTGNGYYGGLQMDRQFQRTYAPRLYRTKGTADNWTAEEQLWTAERAIAARGFSPWPNTARACGVL
jgi:hypothetical protein